MATCAQRRMPPCTPYGRSPSSFSSAGVGPISAPKGLNREVFRHGSVADEPHDPAVDLTLELPEERLESFDFAVSEPLQQLHCPRLSYERPSPAVRGFLGLDGLISNRGPLRGLLGTQVSGGKRGRRVRSSHKSDVRP